MERQDNIVLFPKLAEKLLQKGHAEMENKAYKEAASYFQQAIAIASDVDGAYFGLVICYIETREYEKAVEVAEMMLKRGLGDYYEMLQMYVSLLVQLGKYERAKEVLEAVFFEQKVEAKHYEQLSQLLQVSRQMSHYVDEEGIDNDMLQQLFDRRANVQLNAYGILRTQIDHEKVQQAFLRYLREADEPFIQTLMLEQFIEISYDKKVTIQKLNETMDVVPARLKHPFDWEIRNECIEKIEAEVSDVNPTLAHYMKELAQQYFFIIFPFTSLLDPLPSLLASFEAVASERLGLDFSEQELANKYSLSVQTLLAAIEKIENIEKKGLSELEERYKHEID